MDSVAGNLLRSVYSLEAVTVRAEDINDATDQRPSITPPSCVPRLFRLYRKNRLPRR